MEREFQQTLAQLTAICADRDVEASLADNVAKALEIRKLTLNDVLADEKLKELDFLTSEGASVQWKYVIVASHTLVGIVDFIQDDPEVLLSVNFQKHLKSTCEFIISIGLLPTLIPGVGVSLDKRTDAGKSYRNEVIKPTDKYDRLKSMCNLLGRLCTTSVTKSIVYGHFLKDYFAALLQLAHAPIVRPGTVRLYDGSDFNMTEELRAQLKREQMHYRRTLDAAIEKCYKPLLIKEFLILQSVKEPPPPAFLRKILSKELSNVLASKDGLLSTIKCFFESPTLDVGNQWKHVDVVKKLVAVRHGTTTDGEYLENICGQMKDILEMHANNGYATVIAACIENLHQLHPENESISNLINFIIKPLDFHDNYDNGTLILSSAETNRFIGLIDACYNTPKMCLSSKHLTSIVHSVFRLRTCCLTRSSKDQLDNIILNYFASKACAKNELFEALVFQTPLKDIVIKENISFETVDDGVQVKCSNGSNLTVEIAINAILEIVEDHPQKKEFTLAFYIFCLSKLMTLNKSTDSRELLINEDDVHDLLDKESVNLLILLKALEKLTSLKSVLDSFKDDPGLIVEFVLAFFKDYCQTLERNLPFKNEEGVIICLTLTSVILQHGTDGEALQSSVKRMRLLIGVMSEKSPREEIKFLCTEIDAVLSEGKRFDSRKEDSEFEKALNEICDPLLPVRAHGLMHLTKLIDNKDSETLSKKHYVQCIFEENLKSDDSYIYLSSINGLATMANYSPEDILEVLTREFLDDKPKVPKTKEEENEHIQIRMKIGEVLVKVTKSLGEMAAVHKVILLNTFLCGCRDKDDLIRASSLSNLAEVAQVMSYKIEPILYELLGCVDAILETDKSQECRRASVMVVSSLLRGLGREALYFLREALLPIYRTLKRLYNDEKEDSTVRLHAQIGIEELNNVVRGMIFSPLKMEKKIVMEKPVI